MARRRIYFVSDVHASERCWLKFLTAPKFYGADTVIVGGDITGKFVVPVIAQPNGNWTVQNFLGRQWRLKTGDELIRLKAHIADTGQYAFETTEDEHAQYAGDQPKIDELFRRLALERVRRWVDMAQDRLGQAGTTIMVSGGNDDFFEVDGVLSASSLIQNPDGTVLDLGDGFQIMGIGYGNPTALPGQHPGRRHPADDHLRRAGHPVPRVHRLPDGHRQGARRERAHLADRQRRPDRHRIRLVLCAALVPAQSRRRRGPPVQGDPD